MKKLILLVLVFAVVVLAIANFIKEPKAAEAPVKTAEKNETGPAEIVETFYREWMEAKSGVSERAYRESELIAKSLSAELDFQIDAMSGGGYDPILCAQDRPSSINVAPESIKDDSATVKVREDFVGMTKEIEVGLARGEKGWQINEITCPAQNAFDFETAGNLAKNNPGMEPEVWYLVFEKPGAPAVRTKLIFGENSVCAEGAENNTCEPDKLTVGSRVKILGQKTDDGVKVFRLEKENG